jgi:hypothetical protein
MNIVRFGAQQLAWGTVEQHRKANDALSAAAGSSNGTFASVVLPDAYTPSQILEKYPALAKKVTAGLADLSAGGPVKRLYSKDGDFRRDVQTLATGFMGEGFQVEDLGNMRPGAYYTGKDAVEFLGVKPQLEKLVTKGTDIGHGFLAKLNRIADARAKGSINEAEEKAAYAQAGDNFKELLMTKVFDPDSLKGLPKDEAFQKTTSTMGDLLALHYDGSMPLSDYVSRQTELATQLQAQVSDKLKLSAENRAVADFLIKPQIKLLVLVSSLMGNTSTLGPWAEEYLGKVTSAKALENSVADGKPLNSAPLEPIVKQRPNIDVLALLNVTGKLRQATHPEGNSFSGIMMKTMAAPFMAAPLSVLAPIVLGKTFGKKS